MLVIDLNRLRREGRVRLEAEVAADDPFWQDLDVTPRGPLDVRLEAQQAGHDVVVRGRVRGTFGLGCRRCLEPVTAEIDEDVGLLYREGEVEEEGGEVLSLPETGTELDLTGPVREQVLLAVPRYAYCREDCRGLCPHCGTNLNHETCDCTPEEPDDRWAPLRQLKKDA
jgi:uncharacterized protein